MRLRSSGTGPGATTACEVEWGRIAQAESAGEPTFEVKYAHLCKALGRFPRLEGLATVHVAFRDLVVVPVH